MESQTVLLRTDTHRQLSTNTHTYTDIYSPTMEDAYSDPIKATSNQNASPCSIPLVQSSNLTGIAILLCEKRERKLSAGRID